MNKSQDTSLEGLWFILHLWEHVKHNDCVLVIMNLAC